MGYQALLFCPDEKAARGVTQVLSELDFTVEPCTEPFAAVKKLMAQHFDAIVVDCDNEQNATLLFKSARNSSSNQSSLAVAVVEGQAGVAKAFRIGANLVLTKPINIEQVKGTLRVARGLLRKGGDPAKPAVDSPVPAVAPDATPHAASAPKSPASSSRPEAPSASSTASTTKTWPGPAQSTVPPRSPQPEPARAGASGTAVANDAAPKPDTSSNVEVAPKPAAKPAPAVSQPATAQKKYAWQASKPAVEPMATTLKKAAEAAGIAARPPLESPVAATEKTSATSSPATMSSAAAPAPAKERVPAAAPIVPPAAEAAPVIESAKPAPAELPPAREKNFTETAVNPPAFSMGAPALDEDEPGNSKKALVIVAIVVVLAGMAGYLGWKNMSGKSSTATPNPQVQVPATTPAQPAQGSSPSSSDSAAPMAPAPARSSSPVSMASPVAATPAPKPSAKMIAKDSTTPVAAAPAPSQPPAATALAPPASALVVHTEAAKRAPKPAPSDSDAAPAPSSLGLTSSADSHALAAIGSAPVAVPKASNQVLKISQGVSEGLVLKKVTPRYPSQALQMRIEGSVQLQATIGKDGSISNLKILSGEAILARAAQDAVKQWKYKPYYLNGEPVEIQTQITVNFKLPN